jgi:hypothetical protein
VACVVVASEGDADGCDSWGRTERRVIGCGEGNTTCKL